MQPKTLLAVLSVAIATSAHPNPLPYPVATASSCGAPQVAACCNSVAVNGTGLGCIFSTLNIIPQCTETQTLACCDATQTALIAVGCVQIPITIGK